ncbi:MAG: hypothetical protein UIH27_16435, partial [Ruminococcus sp.]|nr:hypothetical protein [Ruminococcus sp.]
NATYSGVIRVGEALAASREPTFVSVRLYIENIFTSGDEHKAFSREKVAHRLRWWCGYCGSSLYN